MGLIRRTVRSRQDYAEIWDYLAEKAGPDHADKVIRGFDTKLQLLSDFPFAGRARAELRPRLRSFPVSQYLLFYRPVRGGIELIRVLHTSREVRNEFS